MTAVLRRPPIQFDEILGHIEAQWWIAMHRNFALDPAGTIAVPELIDQLASVEEVLELADDLALPGTVASLREQRREVELEIDLRRAAEGDPDAARRVVDARHRRPIPKRRRDAHGLAIGRALRDRADDLGVSPATVLWESTASATVIALTRSKRAVQPWCEAPRPVLDHWVRMLIADEVMDDLVPGWREDEERRRAGATLRPLVPDDDETIASTEDWIAAAESRLHFEEMLDLLAPRQRELLRLMRDGRTTANAAQVMGIAPASGRGYLGVVRDKVQEFRINR
jgi:DNA-binding CsgD family transcriptional regulator